MRSRTFFIVWSLAVVATLGFAQKIEAPGLSTADKVAIQTFEQQKQAAQKQYQDAQQGEMSVLLEWESAHSGWKINPQSFQVEHVPVAAVKPEVKK